jgi:hypothetical protein
LFYWTIVSNIDILLVTIITGFTWLRIRSIGSTRTLPVKGSAHDSGRTMVRAEYGNTEGSPNPKVKHKISRYSYNYSMRLRVHPNELILNPREPRESRRLPKNLPIDLPTRFNT